MRTQLVEGLVADLPKIMYFSACVSFLCHEFIMCVNADCHSIIAGEAQGVTKEIC